MTTIELIEKAYNSPDLDDQENGVYFNGMNGKRCIIGEVLHILGVPDYELQKWPMMSLQNLRENPYEDTSNMIEPLNGLAFHILLDAQEAFDNGYFFLEAFKEYWS